ncbi:hypothetical protein [Kocuria rosea]|uniref:hypothetical protein n=1 Tax=Kocuria rosea TaxID=1275 RepID=UPI000F6FE23B|nr:hypothetical protein [Kocuria rosea]VEI50388.1 Uncharacterised protein [Kocuria rosea]
MIHFTFRHRVQKLSTIAAIGMVVLTGCGADDTPNKKVASTSVAKMEELTTGTLYEATIYARKNDLRYTVEVGSGKTVHVDDTRNSRALARNQLAVPQSSRETL